MKIAIVGSREFPFPEMVISYIEKSPLDSIIVSGGAVGVDTIAVNTAKRLGMEVIVIPAKWIVDNKYDRLAGFKRNIEVVEASDRVVAFWDLMSRGTAHTIALAYVAGKLHTVYTS